MTSSNCKLADRIELWAIDKLIPYARNPRKNDHVIDKMVAAIQEFGFRIPIMARSDGLVVDGHLRLKAAQRLGMIKVPVTLVDDLSETKIKALRLIANRSASWAEWDDELLDLEVEDLQGLGYDLSQIGFSDDELAAMLGGGNDTHGNTDDEAVPEAPVEPKTKLGDIYILGNHRLLCGDSTVLSNVEKVLDGTLADMVFTDPPYNVDYGNTAKDKLRGNDRKIMNDNLGEGFEAFLYDACVNMIAVCKGGIYVCMSSSELHTLQKAFVAAGGKWSTFVIWAKNTFTLGRSDYQRQYEPILYGWKQGADHFWCGARDQGDVWFVNKPRKNDLHPTMKPVELVERAIRNSSKSRDIVLDCFGGSGSTMIACEKTGRQARLIELDPKYCDVIVQRWEEFTGKKAELVSQP
ncbi:MAG: DNA modification methylase [Alphaproteobacteria bacterium]|nr:MAG: DNA modification methylase [Alphaproteobacteria bacterium]